MSKKKRKEPSQKWLNVLALLVLLGIAYLAFRDKKVTPDTWSLSPIRESSYIIRDGVLYKANMRILDKTKLVPEGIVIHETANFNSYADAKWHAIFLDTISNRNVSFHYCVDDVNIVSTYPDSLVAWHAGRDCNKKYLGVEICVNEGINRQQALLNTAKLIKLLRSKYGKIPVTRHSSCMKTGCPASMQDSNEWNKFLSLLN